MDPGQKVTMWIDTNFNQGYGPRAGRLVNVKNGCLVFHSIDYSHMLAFILKDKNTADLLTESTELNDVSIIAIEPWEYEYEIHIFHQDIPLESEPILYGDGGVFAIGWNNRMNEEGFQEIVTDRFRIQRTTGDEFPKFKMRNRSKVDSRLEVSIEPCFGGLKSSIHKIYTPQPMVKEDIWFRRS